MREFVAALAGLFASTVVAGIFAAVAMEAPIADVPLFALIVFGFALIPGFVFGGILFVVLRSFDLVRWWTATLGGGAVGLITAAAFDTPNGPLRILVPVTGGVAGLAFWVVWSELLRRGSRAAAVGTSPTP